MRLSNLAFWYLKYLLSSITHGNRTGTNKNPSPAPTDTFTHSQTKNSLSRCSFMSRTNALMQLLFLKHSPSLNSVSFLFLFSLSSVLLSDLLLHYEASRPLGFPGLRRSGFSSTFPSLLCPNSTHRSSTSLCIIPTLRDTLFLEIILPKDEIPLGLFDHILH